MPAGTATPPATPVSQRARGEGRGAVGLCLWPQSPGEGTSWPGKAGKCAATGSDGLATRVLRTNMPQRGRGATREGKPGRCRHGEQGAGMAGPDVCSGYLEHGP